MMLVLDYIIVNTDRHYNNFGLIRDANTLEWLSVAPIYDSGTSLWCDAILISAINAGSLQMNSKPFNSKHHDQIKHVKDFSWLDLNKLDGIEDEYFEILNTVSDPEAFEIRNKKLCSTLRNRIEILKAIIEKRK